ncbi:hypothetical protein BP6252_05262 [Coleophoma cylindrospora]|uniref:Uncharacterized protein n=1 Tax=Coleophoma cylindrospora TaxID=1849047 RepID=A0A3D8RT44_9HELO|nr:hypothetical protein BP6252_05262 [Coleophoma cylindrospora]
MKFSILSFAVLSSLATLSVAIDIPGQVNTKTSTSTSSTTTSTSSKTTTTSTSTSTSTIINTPSITVTSTTAISTLQKSATSIVTSVTKTTVNAIVTDTPVEKYIKEEETKEEGGDKDYREGRDHDGEHHHGDHDDDDKHHDGGHDHENDDKHHDGGHDHENGEHHEDEKDEDKGVNYDEYDHGQPVDHKVCNKDKHFKTPLCCQEYIHKSLHLDCRPPHDKPRSKDSFKDDCFDDNKTPQCCHVPLGGGGFICERP